MFTDWVEGIISKLSFWLGPDLALHGGLDLRDGGLHELTRLLSEFAAVATAICLRYLTGDSSAVHIDLSPLASGLFSVRKLSQSRGSLRLCRLNETTDVTEWQGASPFSVEGKA